MILSLLHREYSQRANEQQAIPYASRTYCEHYQSSAGKYKVTMPLKHKLGQSIEVDWAGATLKLIDRMTAPVNSSWNVFSTTFFFQCASI